MYHFSSEKYKKSTLAHIKYAGKCSTGYVDACLQQCHTTSRHITLAVGKPITSYMDVYLQLFHTTRWRVTLPMGKPSTICVDVCLQLLHIKSRHITLPMGKPGTLYVDVCLRLFHTTSWRVTLPVGKPGTLYVDVYLQPFHTTSRHVTSNLCSSSFFYYLNGFCYRDRCHDQFLQPTCLPFTSIFWKIPAKSTVCCSSINVLFLPCPLKLDKQPVITGSLAQSGRSVTSNVIGVITQVEQLSFASHLHSRIWIAD